MLGEMSGRLDLDSGGGGDRGSDQLGRFVEAKKAVAEDFERLAAFVSGANDSLTELRMAHEDLVSREAMQEVARLGSTVATIQDILARNHMKVVFFGRTSNGKSTTVNAMLHSRILPQGMGHTTRCFLQVEGTRDGRKYVQAEGSDEERPVDSVEALGSAHCSDTEGEDALVKIFWPAADSRLLDNEVVLVDSPGVDLSHQLDSWIDKHCLDADVFVLVSNAESTLTQAEKNFFHRVSEKLSRPNLFVLNNRWDASANEPESMEQVRSQHMKRFRTFLVDELRVCDPEQVKDRVFFVSAKEVLHQRLKDKSQATPTTFLADGWQARSLEFATFEEQFERVISKSAIQTKFEKHVRQGRDVALRLHSVLEELGDAAARQTDAKSALLDTRLAELRESQRKLLHFVAQSKEHIQRLSQEVQLRVSEEFRDAIRRLDGYVEAYRRPFDDHPHQLPLYKKELIAHLDEAVSQDLNIRFTGGLRDSIERTERQMLENIRMILPEAAGHKATSLLTYREPFRFTVSVDCHGLAEDFQEDLEFRFSLGFGQLVRRFLHLRRAALGSDEPHAAYLPRALSSSGDKASTSLAAMREGPGPSGAGRRGVEEEDALMRSVLMTTATYAANGGVGLLLVGGLVYRTLGWRVIAIGAGAYSGIYLWERARWNSGAKEAALKDQLRRHLAGRLRQLSQIITHNCDAQVTREVGEVLARLQSVASESNQELKLGIEVLRRDSDQLGLVSKRLIASKDEATELNEALGRRWGGLLRHASPQHLPR